MRKKSRKEICKRQTQFKDLFIPPGELVVTGKEERPSLSRRENWDKEAKADQNSQHSVVLFPITPQKKKKKRGPVARAGMVSLGRSSGEVEFPAG